MKMRVLKEIVAGSDDTKRLPVGAVGTVIDLYPVSAEVDFGEYGVWFIGSRHVEDDTVEVFKEVHNGTRME